MSYKPDLLPIGSIIAWSGGYFTAGDNGGTYTSVLGNTVANANAYLESKGYKVCDGNAVNDSKSPIFNGVNRYLPNLTNNRFLQGSTIAGSVATQNSFQINVTNLPPFTISSENKENVSSTSVATNNHTHSLFSGPSGLQQSYSRAVNSSSNYIRNQYINTDQWVASRGASISVSVISSNEAFGINLAGYTERNGDQTTVASTSHIANHLHDIVANAAKGFNQTAIDNRPSYLSIFYIIKIK